MIIDTSMHHRLLNFPLFLFLLLTFVLASCSSVEEKSPPASPFDSLVSEAEQGDASAQFDLALFYIQAAEINQTPYNYQQVLFWAEQSANSGLDRGQVMYARLHLDGVATTKDPAKAFYWYTKAAQQNLPVAQHDLATMYRDGVGTETNYQEAYYWFQKASKNGHLQSYVDLANLLRLGLGTKKHTARAFVILNDAAEQGEPVAQFNLSRMYSDGEGTPADPEKAWFWMEQASTSPLEHLVPEANLGAGLMLTHGLGVEKDLVRGCGYFEKSSRAGSAEGSRLTALCYLSGKGRSEDTDNAIKYFLLSSEQGSNESPFSLALLYLQEKRVAKDQQKGMDWLQIAAERNNVRAKELLASMNKQEEAQALKKTYDHAVELLEQGKDAQAEVLLLGFLDQSSEQVDVFAMLGLAQIKQEKYKAAIKTLTEGNALFPKNPKVMGLLGTSYARNGDYETALKFFEKSLAIDPSSTVTRQERDATAFNLSKYSDSELNQMQTKAYKYLNEGKPAAAEEIFRTLLNIKTDHAQFYAYTGISISMQGKYQEAIAVLEEGNTVLPNNVEILANLGYVESLLGNTAKAISYYQQVLAIDPNHKNTLYNLQKATLDLGSEQSKSSQQRQLLRQ